jgi:beta-glucosidase-like glycosyl hydrolase
VNLTRRLALFPALLIAAAAIALIRTVPGSTPANPATITGTPDQTAEKALAGMSLAQRVGQLFMVSTPADGSNVSVVTGQIDHYHLGNIFLSGRSSAGVTATAGVTAGLRTHVSTATTDGVPLLIGTDQEGGYVQVLSGPGFSTIPTGLTQGSWPTQTLTTNATIWARQLHAAGVNIDLAPVTDTVKSASFAGLNRPIGYFQREFGFDSGTVASHSIAFTNGMAAAGVGTVIKHFPGLGFVTGNTDDTVDVTDAVTTRTSPAVAAFDSAIAAGAPAVMVSSARYTAIDPTGIATFSPTVMLGMLRGDAKFDGVIMTDSVAATALSPYPPATRALNFLAAGGDLVLTTDASTLQAMVNAVLARAQTDSAFLGLVDTSALRVLRLKAQLGVLPPITVPASPSAPPRSQPWGVRNSRHP